MSLLPTVGGLGAATIAGTLFSKLTPAAILWTPQTDFVQVAPTPENQTNAPNSGTFPASGLAPIIDGTVFGSPNENYTKPQSLIFHCVASEAYSIANSVTKFPVDSGFNVSDHTIRQNPVIQLEGVVSNTPMSTMDITSLAGIIQVGGAILGTGLGGVLNSAIGLGQALVGGSQKANADYFHENLEMLVKTGQLVTVSTLRGLYDNCVVTSYSTKADVDSSTSLHFTITLEKLYVVDSGGEVLTQTNQALYSLPKIAQSKISGYINSIGIGVLGSVVGLL